MNQLIAVIIKKITINCLFVLFCGLAISLHNARAETPFSQINSSLINYASTKDIRDIHPHFYSGEMAAQNMVFESLVINSEQGVKPHLAKSWHITNEGKTYHFTLRDDVYFHDGEKFDAQAVKQNIDAVVNNAVQHGWLELVNQIERVEVVSDYEVVLQLKNAYYPTLIELGLTRPFRFISPKQLKRNANTLTTNQYSGTGPWQLSEYKKEQYALFQANQHYWGKLAKVSAIKWHVMPEHQTMLFALEKGEIDLIFGSDGDMVAMDAFDALQKQGKFITQLSHPIASRALVLNTRQPIFSDKNLRLALQHAINKRAIADGIFNGIESVADTLMSRTTPYCDIGDMTTYDYQPLEAQAYFDKAGWLQVKGQTYRQKQGKTLQIILSYNNKNASEQMIAELIQSDLRRLGVELVLLGEETNQFLDRQKRGEFDIQFSQSWGTPYDPQSYVSSFRVPSHADYQGQAGLASKPYIDKVISELLITPDDALRKTLYRDLFRLLADEAVYVPLTYSKIKVVHTKRLQGVTFNPSQYEIPFEKFYFAD